METETDRQIQMDTETNGHRDRETDTDGHRDIKRDTDGHRDREAEAYLCRPPADLSRFRCPDRFGRRFQSGGNHGDTGSCRQCWA